MVSADSPYLETKYLTSVQDGSSRVSVRVRKHRCNRNWCPSCWQGSLGFLFRELRGWDFRRVRHVVLTMRRDGYEGGEDAHYEGKRRLRLMIHDLKRTWGVDVKEWVWFLEWHKDGFPHWHLLILVGSSGAGGQIGYDAIDKYWGLGGVHESYFASAVQWESFTGYFKKTGYLEKGKAHQGKLPVWGEGRKSLRRCGGSFNLGRGKNVSVTLIEILKDNNALKRVVSSLGYAIENCGCSCEISYRREDGLWSRWVHQDIPYECLRKLDGEYVQGRGWEFMIAKEYLYELLPDPELILCLDFTGKEGGSDDSPVPF
jgi:hypothetical protein